MLKLQPQGNHSAHRRREQQKNNLPETVGWSSPANIVYYGLKDDGSNSYAPPGRLRAFLRAVLPKSITYDKKERKEDVLGPIIGLRQSEVSPFVDKLATFIIAFVGGAALIVPMVLMTLHSSKAKSLITVSVAVLLFAIIVAFAFKLPYIDTVMATTTYAAVLVVFVGVGSGGA
jgi:hypothetical protein